MTMSKSLATPEIESELDEAAGQGLSNFVSFLKSTARETDALRAAEREENSPN